VEKTLIEDIESNYSGEMSSLEILEKIIISHISAIEQRKGVTFQVIAEIISLGDKKLNKKVFEAITRYISRIREILIEGIKTGVIKPDIEPEAAARLFFGITQGLVNLWALSQYTFDLEQEYRAMWNIFLQAIAVKTAGQTSLPVQN